MSLTRRIEANRKDGCSNCKREREKERESGRCMLSKIVARLNRSESSVAVYPVRRLWDEISGVRIHLVVQS